MLEPGNLEESLRLNRVGVIGDAARVSSSIKSELPGRGKVYQKDGEEMLARAGATFDHTVCSWMIGPVVAFQPGSIWQLTLLNLVGRRGQGQDRQRRSQARTIWQGGDTRSEA